MKGLRIISWLLPVLLFACSGRPAHETPPPPEFIPNLNGRITNELSSLPKLDHALDSFLDFWTLHGASLAIMRNDSLVYARGYGMADESTPMTPGTTLRLASVSKLLTAVGIMRLQEQGLVFLDTPVFGPAGVLGPDFDAYIRDENYCLITVEHLLRHQAGFTVYGGDPMFTTLTIMRNYGLSSPPSAHELVRRMVAKPLSYQPGSTQQYSNFGYLLLSLIIEKVSGMSYEDFMQQEVFQPCGCEAFSIAGNYLKDRQPGESKYYMQPDSERCPSYDGRFASVEKCYGGNDISSLKGAGAWIGSAVEMARLVACIDGKGPVEDIISAESVRQMTTWFDEDTFSLGWVDTKPTGEWTRTGSFSGTSALVKVYPDGECWIFISNTSAWRGSRFTKDTAALLKRLRESFSAQLPRRDLFTSED